MVRVALLSDEPVAAEGLRSVLSSRVGLELALTCDNPSKVVEVCQTQKPDVVLLDLTPDPTFGILTTLRREVPECRIVLWVRTISTEVAYQAMELGVRGILRKSLPTELLVKCLSKVAEGELWFDKSLTASFVARRTAALTKRESQLVSLLAQGFKNREIAATLSISEGTVKVYLSRLFAKLGLKDRFELALYGLRELAGPAWEESELASVPRVAATAREPALVEWPAVLVGREATLFGRLTDGLVESTFLPTSVLRAPRLVEKRGESEVQSIVRRLMTHLELGADELGRAFGVTGETIRRWESGEIQVSGSQSAQLIAAGFALERLLALFHPQRIPRVIRRRAAVFAGERAVDWILQGRIAEVADRYETALAYHV